LVKKLTAILMFAMLLMSMFPFTPTIKPAKAWIGIVYIRADGSIDPSTAPIKRDERTYTFTADIYGSIVVETNNIMIDGAGYVLKGIGNGTGIDLSGRNRITIKNVNIENFYYGILLGCSFSSDSFSWIPSFKNIISSNTLQNNVYGIQLSRSSNNSIFSNKIINNDCGIELHFSSNNSIFGNGITNNRLGINLLYSLNNKISSNEIKGNNYGIHLFDSTNNSILSNNVETNDNYGLGIKVSCYNVISSNSIIDNGGGVFMWEASDNNISSNIIESNNYGICFYDSKNNIIFHNNFINNAEQIEIISFFIHICDIINVFDNNYPSGGNYWSDYNGVDEKSGPDQDLPGCDGIGDTPYVINENNKDRYPFIQPFDIPSNPIEPPSEADNVVPSVKVLAPNGGEALTVGSVFRISWEATDNVGVSYIQIWLIQDSSEVMIIAENIPNTGYYDWAVPNRVGSGYKVRIAAVDLSGNTGYDISDGTFTIQVGSTKPPVLRVVGWWTNGQPIAKVPFTVTVLVSNEGDEAVPAPQLSYDSSMMHPLKDAIGATPILSISPSPNNPPKILSKQQVKLNYTCFAYWNFIAPPEFMDTLLDSLIGVAESAAVDALGMGVLKYAEMRLTPKNYKIFEKIWELASFYASTTKDGIVALIEVMELMEGNEFTAGVIFPLVLVQHAVQSQVDVGELVMVAPPYKFQELNDWARAKIGAFVVSSACSLIGTALLPTAAVTFGILPGVFYAIAALAGPVTDAWYRSSLVDPADNYMELVTIPSPPSIIISLPKDTYGQLAYHFYMYIVYLNASVEASLRAYGALQADSTYYANLQLNSAKEFALNATEHFENFRYYLNLTLNDLKDIVNEANFTEGLRILDEEGLPTESIEFLRATGTLNHLNTTWIKNLTFEPLDPTDVCAQLPNLGNCMRNEIELKMEYVELLENTENNPTPPQQPKDWVSLILWIYIAGAFTLVTATTIILLKAKRKTAIKTRIQFK
jgi:parallel beta-helix repeat protein